MLLSNIICFVLGWLTCVAHEQLYEQFENLGSTAEDDFIDVRHLQALKAEPFRGLAATEECRGALDALLGISPAVAQTIHAEIDRYSGDHQNRALWAGTELSRHYKSKTFLQDAFVRLHNFLFAAKLLPLVEWGKGRGIDISSRSALAPWLLNATKVGRGTGYAGYHAGPSVISRLAINAYVLAERVHIAPGSVCLGWDSTEFVDLVPGCVREQSWALVFKNGKVKVDVAQRKVHADIASLVDASAVSSVPRFDLIICQEVFEHVRRPADGAKGLYNLLRSGGRVLFTVPFNSHFHLIPTDFFRYSLDGARSLLADAGLTVERTYKIGNSAIASGFMLGFGAGDFNIELMEHKLLQPVTEPVGSSQRQGLKLDPAVPPKDLMAALPANVRWKADNYNHLWEQPTIFYPIVIIAALLPGTGAADLGLAWAFVALRVAHSVWQATINAIEVRFVLFALSSLVLLALVVRTWVALLA